MRPSRAAILCVILSLAGLALCTYLAFLHIALLRGELLGGAACGTAGTIFNCHAVTASPYGSVLGLPLALWGLIGYLATLSLAFIGWQFPDWTAAALRAVVSLSLLFVAIDAGLLVVMLTQIRYLCPLCLLTYAVNLLLLFVARRGVAQPWRDLMRRIPASLGAWVPKPRVAAIWIFWGVVLTGAMGTVAVTAAVTYFQQGAPGTLHKQIAEFVGQQRRATVDTTGAPVSGLANRPIQIVEFSDLLCPSCQRASMLNPIILAGHRQDVMFVFKHFPLDLTCNTAVTRTAHEGACQVAVATACAHEQGKFWAFHDLIFGHGSPYKASFLEADARRLGLDMTAFGACMQSGRGLEAVKRDIAEGARLGVVSTPTYFVNGVSIVGVLVPAMFDEFLRVLRQASS